jgi:hypothetical protein
MAKTTKRGSKAKVRSKHALKDLPPSGGRAVRGGGTNLRNMVSKVEENMQQKDTLRRAQSVLETL